MFAAPAFNQNLPPNAFPNYPPQPQLPPSIPMIGDRKITPKPEITRQNLPPIPPTPYPGLPETGGLNWNIIAACSPEEVLKTNDVKTIEAILSSFVNSQFSNVEAQLLPNPLAAKFYRLLQISVQFLFDTQRELEKIIKETQKNNDSLKNKLRALTHAFNKLKNKIHKPSDNSEKCVVCHKVFKSLDFLDSHMQRRHAALVPAWRSLRTGYPHGLEDINDELVNLRLQISKARSELARVQKEQAENVHHIIEQPDMQLRALRELNDKQNELLEQHKNQERAQMNFRREVRNQLDNALVTLRQSQRRLEEQVLQLPPMPKPQITPHDDLEMSLTQQLMQQYIQPQQQQQRSSPQKPPISNKRSRISWGPEVVLGQQQDDNTPVRQSSIQENKEDTFNDLKPIQFQPFTGNPVTISKQSPIRSTQRKTIIEANFDTEDKKTVIPHVPERTQEFKPPDKVLHPRQQQPDELTKDYKGTPGEYAKGFRVVRGNTLFDEVEEPSTGKKKRSVEQSIIDRAKAFLAKPEEYEPMKKSVRNKLTQDILLEVTQELDKVKQTRPAVPPTDIYTAKLLNDNTKEYVDMHDQLLIEVDQISPVVDYSRASLFQPRNAVFPTVKPKPRPILKTSTKGKLKTYKPSSPGQVPDADADLSKIKGHRPRDNYVRQGLVPDESDIISETSASTTSTSADRMPAFIDKPLLFKNHPNFGKRARRENKEYKPISKLTTSSSQIQPLSEEDQDSVFDIEKEMKKDEEEDIEEEEEEERHEKPKSKTTKEEKEESGEPQSVSSVSSTSSSSKKKKDKQKKKSSSSTSSLMGPTISQKNTDLGGTGMVTDSSSSSLVNEVDLRSTIKSSTIKTDTANASIKTIPPNQNATSFSVTTKGDTQPTQDATNADSISDVSSSSVDF